MIAKWYTLWMQEKGTSVEVNKLHFIGRSNKVFYDKYTKKTYTAEVWECETAYGQKALPFRVESILDTDSESSNVAWKDVEEQGMDYLTCTIEECETGIKLENPILVRMDNEQKNNIELLTKAYQNETDKYWKKVLLIYLRFLETPNLAFARVWQQLKKEQSLNGQIVMVRYKK